MFVFVRAFLWLPQVSSRGLPALSCPTLLRGAGSPMVALARQEVA